MVKATKMWRWPRFFGVSWFEIAKFGVLGLEIMIWFAPTYHEMKSRTPTEKYRRQYEKQLTQELRLPVSVKSVVDIDGDRPGIVAFLDEEEVQPLLERIVRANRDNGRISTLSSNLIEVDGRFFQFFRYRGRVLVVSSDYKEMLGELLENAVNDDSVVKAYRKLK
jgi:hypothetical protein